METPGAISACCMSETVERNKKLREEIL